MPSAEAAEQLVSIGETLGFLILGAIGFWLKTYHDGRSHARAQDERSPDIAAKAVGAAFIDVSTAQHLAQMAHDISEILKLLVGWEETRKRTALKDELREELAEQMRHSPKERA